MQKSLAFIVSIDWFFLVQLFASDVSQKSFIALPLRKQICVPRVSMSFFRASSEELSRREKVPSTFVTRVEHVRSQRPRETSAKPAATTSACKSV